MKKLLIFLSLCGGVSLITYFCHEENSLAEKMKVLYGMEVILPMEEMLLVHPEGKNCSFGEDAEYKVVVFYDSLSCSPCTYKNMYIWNDFIEEANKTNNRVQFYFIMNPSQGEKNDLFKTLQMPNGFAESILIDTAGVFIEANKFISQNVIFHYMLLDSTDRIKIFGDPTRNDRIKELFLNTMSN